MAPQHRSDHWVGIAQCRDQAEVTLDINSGSISVARLAGEILACSELRCLSKDRLPPRGALYGGFECDDQPQRSGYVQVARVDSIPGKWWVWSEFLLRARRGSGADRRRDTNSPGRAARAAQRVTSHRGKNHLHAASTLMGPHQPRLTRVAPGWGRARQHHSRKGQ